MRGAVLMAGAAALLPLGGCATRPAAPVAPAAPPPPATPALEPLPPAPPAPPPGWEDEALTPGDWRYSDVPAARADYGEGASAAFSIRCDPAARRILLSRPDAAAGAALTLRTTFGKRTITLAEGGAAALPATDPLLDDIAFSRGRIAVEAPGLPTFILPTWPEPARVVEECRP
jgi:hypothetical protein